MEITRARYEQMEDCHPRQRGNARLIDLQVLNPSMGIIGLPLAAAVALLAKERRGPPLRCQALMHPLTDANSETHSYNEYADGYWLTKIGMKRFWNAYLLADSRRKDRLAAPLQATLAQFADLPPA